MRRRTKGGGEEVREAGEAASGCGNGGRRHGRAGKGGGGGRRKEMAPTGGPTCRWLRERGGGRGGGVDGPCGPKADWAVGLGWVDRLDLFFSFSFPFLFKSIFKPI
jgi:hypothetical protein